VADNHTRQTEDSSAPLYLQLKQTISHQISNGSLQPNQRVPSESELVKSFNVSRMTANRALRELASEGLLVRIQGVGTFVADTKPHSELLEIHNIADEIIGRGHRHSCKQIELIRLKAQPEQALNLGVRTNHGIFKSRLVHYENELPVQLEERYVNAELVPEYMEQDFTKITPHAYLMKVAPLTEGEHLVEAVKPDEHECQLLQIELDEPCLKVNRRTWSGSDIITSSRLLYPGSRYQLIGHFSH
jgi:GntR family histidine utilization transcriptional repressor